MAVGIVDSGDVVRQVIAVLIVFGLLAFAVRKLRSGDDTAKSGSGGMWRSLVGSLQGPIFKAREGKAGESRQLVSVERLKLTQQHTLHLVRAGNRDVLIVTHAQGCSLLSDGSRGDLLASSPMTEKVSA